MDPKFNDQWSTSEIRMVKSLITSHNANNNYTDDTNNKHNDIVNEIQERLPWKGRHKVIEMYVQIVVEMISMQSAQSGNLSIVATLNNFNDNFGIPVENQTMDNMDMSLAYLTNEQPEAMKVVVEVPQSQVIIPQQEGQKKERSWTIEEHRKFLQGLRECGRGSWKKISRDFVKTKTPVQISSHAQKYFRRQERTSEKKRHSINDVGLNDAEFGVQMQNNSSSWEALAFAGGVYNPNCYGFDGQLAAVNNHGQVWPPLPYYAGQASSSNQATTWTGQQIEAGSYAAPTPEEAGSQMAFNGDHQGDFLPSNGFDGQLAAVNNHGQVWPPFPYCAGQASSSNQAPTTGQQIEAGSYAAPTPEEAGNQMAFNGDHQGDFLPSNGWAE